MEITEEEDIEWHRDNQALLEKREHLESINPFMLGGGFLDLCIGKGWARREGTCRSSKYYVTEQGKGEIRKYGIKL